MDRTAPNLHIRQAGRILRAAMAPIGAVGRFLVMLAEAGPRMEEVRRLNAMTDEALAARGLTRAGEVRRIFSDRYYI